MGDRARKQEAHTDPHRDPCWDKQPHGHLRHDRAKPCMHTRTQKPGPASMPSSLLWRHLQDRLLETAGEYCELQGVGTGSQGGCPPVRAKIPAAAVSSHSQGQEEECGQGSSTVLEAGGLFV